MRLRHIGEFGLIDRIARRVKNGKSVVRGIGDDAAVLKWTKDAHLLATADMLIEDRHFTRAAPARKVGWKALCCGISDIAAMGGEPKWALVSAGLPKGLQVKYVDGVYAGMKEAAEKFGVSIVGGDTNASDKIILDVMVLGEAKKERLVLRNGAKPGDYIFVTGSLGGSIRGKHLNFTPRLKESRTLVKNFKVSAMIDLSDGLSGDLSHILRQSGVGAVVYSYLIPLSPHPTPSPQRGEGRGEGGRIQHALSDGEDFELLFTMPPKDALRLLDLRKRLFSVAVTRIGTVVDKKYGARLIDIFGRKKELQAKGFRHF